LKQTKRGIAPMTKQSANLPRQVRVIDGKSLNAIRFYQITDRALSALHVEHLGVLTCVDTVIPIQ
jgi:hypothetical protein